MPALGSLNSVPETELSLWKVSLSVFPIWAGIRTNFLKSSFSSICCSDGHLQHNSGKHVSHEFVNHYRRDANCPCDDMGDQKITITTMINLLSQFLHIYFTWHFILNWMHDQVLFFYFYYKEFFEIWLQSYFIFETQANNIF